MNDKALGKEYTSPKNTPVREMFSRIARRYDMANTILSAGIHHIWKRRLINLCLEHSPSRVADLCCGTGDIAIGLAKVGIESIGVDFSDEMLSIAKERAKSEGIAHKVKFIKGDVLSLPFADEEFDCVTVAFGVRNLPDLARGLREVKRAIKRGGLILILEFGQPDTPIISSAYAFYSKYLIPILGGIIAGDPMAYRYLHRTSLSFPSGQEFANILSTEGFLVCDVIKLTFGIAYIYTARAV